MSDTLYESEILKSLETLDDILSKAQIQKERPGNHRPMGVDWAGTDVEEEEEKDAVPDGTDYKSVKKGYGAEQYEEGKEEEEEDLGKSVRSGVEVSDFLNALAKSIAVYCADLEDHVVKSLGQIHEENGAMSKAIAENLAVLGDVVAKSQGNIADYAEGPARGPKSMLNNMSKSVSGSDEPELSKSVVLGALMKGVEAGTVSPLEVLKVEQFGVQAINQDVVKSLLA
jgi:hypothetical protein